MIDFAQVQKGISAYLDNEVMPAFKDEGWKRVAVGAAIAIAIKKSDSYLPLLMENQVVKTLGIIDENGGIDVDTLVPVLKDQLDREPMTIAVPMLGNLTFKSADVDKLHDYIRTAR